MPILLNSKFEKSMFFIYSLNKVSVDALCKAKHNAWSWGYLTHSRRALFKVFDSGFGQIEDILGIILVKEFFKKSN